MSDQDKLPGCGMLSVPWYAKCSIVCCWGRCCNWGYRTVDRICDDKVVSH